ncbi:glycosyltransferase family 2 protein [Adhaeribacter sp. BT258]|uniref:Glycosyltransferase family 2 protein n=1 Tax=Adhaeribacter terrigena TaxID=2793070 RepID=A0ABS1C4G4_9BACT|nr:glycosyltransferase family 2 protein [Adhaeribacter terrigena]MBK0404252.1 glycosyltransferase family 2 protein [Adhaeribacter terrigena]
MKVSGFTFVKNAVQFSYPIVEAITSILPVCDEFIVSVGDCEDGTLELIQSINSPKIKIIRSVWDNSLREGGKVLAVETNKALDAISEDSDWAFYIQGDEVVHEKYLDTIKQEMQRWKDKPEVEGLLFKYLHFYGTYDFVANSRGWYRHEIRIIRNDKAIRSFKDAQGFRKNDRKLRVKPIDAYVYHYGWVKHPADMKKKEATFHKLWHDDAWVKEKVETSAVFDYSKIDSLGKFTGTHPAVMQKRLQEVNWHLNFDPSRKNLSLKKRLLHWFEQKTGVRLFEYKNYQII